MGIPRLIPCKFYGLCESIEDGLKMGHLVIRVAAYFGRVSYAVPLASLNLTRLIVCGRVLPSC